MENLICHICDSLFSNINEVVKHLKHVHKFKDNKQIIPCVVNFENSSFCTSTYLTFNGLRNHVKSCVSKKDDENIHIEEISDHVIFSSCLLNICNDNKIKFAKCFRLVLQDHLMTNFQC